MTPLIGTYECKADSKGRIMLPVAFKKQLSDVSSQGFVLKRAVFQNCLEFYPMGEWNRLMGHVNKLNRFVKKNNDFIRRFTAGVKPIELDNTGRFLIPKDLIHFSGIQKEVVMTSAINIIEVWEKQEYEKAINDATTDFAELAETVMGKEYESGELP